MVRNINTVFNNRLTDFSFLHQQYVYLSGLGAGEVGLVLTYAVTLVGNFQWTMRQSAEVENMVRSEGLFKKILIK